jgi:hypothetical protein
MIISRSGFLKIILLGQGGGENQKKHNMFKKIGNGT